VLDVICCFLSIVRRFDPYRSRALRELRGSTPRKMPACRIDLRSALALFDYDSGEVAVREWMVENVEGEIRLRRNLEVHVLVLRKHAHHRFVDTVARNPDERDLRELIRAIIEFRMT
jgi:hypothetical protein